MLMCQYQKWPGPGGVLRCFYRSSTSSTTHDAPSEAAIQIDTPLQTGPPLEPEDSDEEAVEDEISVNRMVDQETQTVEDLATEGVSPAKSTVDQGVQVSENVTKFPASDKLRAVIKEELRTEYEAKLQDELKSREKIPTPEKPVVDEMQASENITTSPTYAKLKAKIEKKHQTELGKLKREMKEQEEDYCQQVTGIDQARVAAEDKCEEKEKELEDLYQNLDRPTDSEVQALNQKNNTLTAQNESIRKQNEAIHKEREKLRKENGEYRRMLDATKESLKQKNAEIAEKNGVTDEAISQAMVVDNQHTQAECQNDSCADTIRELLNSVDKWKESYSEAFTANKELGNNLARAELQIKDGTKYVAGLHHELGYRDTIMNEMRKIMLSDHRASAYFRFARKLLDELSKVKDELRARIREIQDLYILKREFDQKFISTVSESAAELQLWDQYHHAEIEKRDHKIFILNLEVANLKRNNTKNVETENQEAYHDTWSDVAAEGDEFEEEDDASLENNIKDFSDHLDDDFGSEAGQVEIDDVEYNAAVEERNAAEEQEAARTLAPTAMMIPPTSPTTEAENGIDHFQEEDLTTPQPDDWESVATEDADADAALENDSPAVPEEEGAQESSSVPISTDDPQTPSTPPQRQTPIFPPWMLPTPPSSQPAVTPAGVPQTPLNFNFNGASSTITPESQPSIAEAAASSRVPTDFKFAAAPPRARRSPFNFNFNSSPLTTTSTAPTFNAGSSPSPFSSSSSFPPQPPNQPQNEAQTNPQPKSRKSKSERKVAAIAAAQEKKEKEKEKPKDGKVGKSKLSRQERKEKFRALKRESRV